VVVVNTCTVTERADAQARRFVRKVQRENPGARVVVAGCSAALQAPVYRKLGVHGVVPGPDPVQVAGVAGLDAPPKALVQLEHRGSLDRMDTEPVGGELLRRRASGTRGWLKIQDGCDRKCSFCATRLARGASRSRTPDEVVAEARLLAATHPEIVLTGIHIGHYGLDLEPATTLARLVARLLHRVPEVRFRLGSVEATEVDDLLLELLAGSGGRLAPHLHMPLQSGADPVLRRMRRWHTREMYRSRALQIAARLPVLGLGADIITGFPGETDADHRATRALVEELPYTYLHVFPFSPRRGTPADDLRREDPVPQRVAGERSRELREIVEAKARTHLTCRLGDRVRVVVEEGRELRGLTGDYLRLPLRPGTDGPRPAPGLRAGSLQGTPDDPYIDLPPAGTSPSTDPPTPSAP
jgi:threonylcarbamoyladenosine tRNA methylthiotransferase MtaB